MLNIKNGLRKLADVMKLVLGWSDKMKTEKKVMKTAFSVYWDFGAGEFKGRTTNEPTKTPAVWDSLFYMAGLRPAFFKVVCPKTEMTAQQFADFTKVHPRDIVYRNKEGKLRVHPEYSTVLSAWEKRGQVFFKFRFDKSTFPLYSNYKLCNKIVENALAAQGMTRGDLLPAHPSMIESGDKNDIMLVVRAEKQLTWNEWATAMGIDPEDHDIFLRAGKDGWGKPIDGKYHILNVKIIEGDGVSHDGNEFIRGGIAPSGECLTRCFPFFTQNKDKSITIDGGKFFVGKARTMEFADGELYNPFTNERETDKNIHRLTTADNIKWAKVKPGDVIKTITFFVKNEDVEAKEKYSLNALSAIMGNWTMESRTKITDAFHKQAKTIAKFGENPTKNVLNTINDNVNGSEGVQFSEKIGNIFSGLASVNQFYELISDMMRRIKSVQLSQTIYPSIIFAKQWMGRDIARGTYLAGDTTKKLLKARNYDVLMGAKHTVCRYPLVSNKSFLQIQCAGDAVNLHGNIIVMNPEDAGYLQGDGDDHVILLLDLVSTFVAGSDESDIERVKLPDNITDRIHLFFKGATAEKSIGSAFNNMLKVLAVYKDCGKDPKYVFSKFGGALDQFAQGIKKNFTLPDNNDLRAERDKLIGQAKREYALSNSMIGKVASDAADHVAESALDDVIEYHNYKTNWELFVNMYLGKEPEHLDDYLMELWGIRNKSMTYSEYSAANKEFVNKAIKYTIHPQVLMAMKTNQKNSVHWISHLMSVLDSVTGNQRDIARNILLNPESTDEQLNGALSFYRHYYRMYLSCAANSYAMVCTAQNDWVRRLWESRLERFNGLSLMLGRIFTDGIDPKGRVEVIKTLQDIEATVKPVEETQTVVAEEPADRNIFGGDIIVDV